MPIAINGSGTLTGLSVGGLENGIITPAELSTGAPSWDAQYNLTNVASINGGPLAGFRNAIINGNFDIWQRGTSFVNPASSTYTSDRWITYRTGSSATHSRQAFTLGQTSVPGEPTYFFRAAVTTSAGAGNFVHIQQKIESVRTFAGQQITVSFWAKADAAKPISVELEQSFGTGGSPSAAIQSLSVTKVTLGTSWQKVTVTATVPSISGKTLGSDNNDVLGINIWFDAGSNFNARTDTLGQQSGTFDIAQVQVEAGPVASTFERRPIGTELALCQRYYSVTQPSLRFFSTSTSTQTWETYLQWPVLMRATPTITLVAGSRSNVNTVAILDLQNKGARFSVVCSGILGDVYSLNETVNASAEL